jgi:hypothetical protein
MSGGKTPHDKALYIDGGPMLFTPFSFGLWLKMRPGGATRGQWRIPDGKSESGLFSCSEL